MKRTRRYAVQPKLPESLSLDILKFSHDGRGIARHEGRVVMVSNALPGEKVIAKIETGNSNLWQGKSISVLSASALRKVPECALYGRCGGCQQQHIAHDDQLALKQDAVSDHFKRNELELPEWEKPIISSEYKYRHRARFHISKKGKIGFHAQKGNDVIEVDDCPVLIPKLQESFFSLKTAPLIGLSQIELVVDDFDQVGVKALKGSRSAIELFQQWVDSMKWQTGTKLRYVSGDYEVTAFPGEFTQVNRAVNEKLIRQALQWLNIDPGDRVLDLFCGNGNFSLAFQDRVADLLGLEASESAIAQANQAIGTESDFKFQVENLFTADLQKLDSINKLNPTTVILDPPRAGAEQVCESLKHLPSVEKILYVSCDPATLSRDIKILCGSKWHLRKLGLVDMFPQTRHIETMVLLEKNKR